MWRYGFLNTVNLNNSLFLTPKCFEKYISWKLFGYLESLIKFVSILTH